MTWLLVIAPILARLRFCICRINALAGCALASYLLIQTVDPLSDGLSTRLGGLSRCGDNIRVAELLINIVQRDVQDRQ